MTKAVSLSNGKIRVIDSATCILESTVHLTAVLLHSTKRLLPRFDNLIVTKGSQSSTWISALAWSPFHICRNRRTPLDPHSASFVLIRYPV